jgi:hypothetical protein
MFRKKMVRTELSYAISMFALKVFDYTCFSIFIYTCYQLWKVLPK